MKFKLNALAHVLNLCAATESAFQPESVTRFDRATFYLDSPQLPASVRSLRAEAADVRMTIGAMPHQPRWQSKLDVFQPTPAFFEVLIQVNRAEISAMPIYVELACDISMPSVALAEARLREFVGSAYVRYLRQEVLIDRSTYYYGRRRDPQVLVGYADRPSKLASPIHGSPCLHFEWRLSGAGVLRKAGLACVADFIQFDHPAFWDSAVHMLNLPGKIRQGRLLGGRDRAEVGDAALRKRARVAHDAAKVEYVMVMQHLVSKYPKLIRIAERSSFSTWANLASQRDTGSRDRY